MILQRQILHPAVSELEIACVFGGATLLFPMTGMLQLKLLLYLEASAIHEDLIPGRTIDPSKHLLIKGAVVFGGGEVKSY